MWILHLRVPQIMRQIQHQLQAAQESTRLVDKGRVVTPKKVTQTIANICGFVMHKCVHQGEMFFSEESELAYDEKYEKIKNWTTKLHFRDYELPDLF